MDDCSEADVVIDFDDLMENESLMSIVSVDEANTNKESSGANTTIEDCFLEYLDNEESLTVAQIQGELTLVLISLFCTIFVLLLDDNTVL